MRISALYSSSSSSFFPFLSFCFLLFLPSNYYFAETCFVLANKVEQMCKRSSYLIEVVSKHCMWRLHLSRTAIFQVLSLCQTARFIQYWRIIFNRRFVNLKYSLNFSSLSLYLSVVVLLVVVVVVRPSFFTTSCPVFYSTFPSFL